MYFRMPTNKHFVCRYCRDTIHPCTVDNGCLSSEFIKIYNSLFSGWDPNLEAVFRGLSALLYESYIYTIS